MKTTLLTVFLTAIVTGVFWANVILFSQYLDREAGRLSTDAAGTDPNTWRTSTMLPTDEWSMRFGKSDDARLAYNIAKLIKATVAQGRHLESLHNRLSALEPDAPVIEGISAPSIDAMEGAIDPNGT